MKFIHVGKVACKECGKLFDEAIDNILRVRQGETYRTIRDDILYYFAYFHCDKCCKLFSGIENK